MTMYDDSRVVTLLREIDPPLGPPDRLHEVRRRARRSESRRATALAGVMAVVLVAGVLSAFHLGDRGGTQVLTVAGAAKATKDTGSARVTIRVRLTKSRSSFMPAGDLIALTGPVDFRRQRLLLKGSFAKAPIEMRAIGRDRWINSPETTAGTPGAKPWVHSVEKKPTAATDFSSMDPSVLLDVLTSKGTVVSSSTDGDRTKTVLRLPADAFRLAFGADAAGAGTEVTVETDSDGRIRETTAEVTMAELGTMRTTTRYDDFGLDVLVEPPPADQVREDTDTGSSGSVVQTTPLQGSSSPEQQKQVCDQMKAARAQMPAPQTEQERQQRAQFDEILAKACPKG